MDELKTLRRVCAKAGADIAKAYYDYQRVSYTADTLDKYINYVKRDAWNVLSDIEDDDQNADQDADQDADQ